MCSGARASDILVIRRAPPGSQPPLRLRQPTVTSREDFVEAIGSGLSFALCELVDSALGKAGMSQYADDLEAVWDNWHSEDDRFLAAGDDRVVWLYRIVGQGKGSGVPVDQPIAIVWTLRDGLIWRGEAFLDQQQALKAVGLEE
jgi:hypothetical protein